MARISHADRKVRRVQMAEAVKAGTSIDEVLKQFDVSIGTVRIACKENGVQFSNRRSTPTNEEPVVVSESSNNIQ